MPRPDRHHFDQYSEQTKTKHAILTAYLPAYLTALKSRAKRFHYIDAFAGRGRYEDEIPGSPLRALTLIAESNLANRTSVSLVEDKPKFFRELEQCVLSHESTPTLFDRPLIRQGKFSDHINEVLDRDTYHRPGKVGTFTFVDPCGIAGVEMQDLVRLLTLQYGEIILFFNQSALGRVLGAVESGTQEDEILRRLFGSARAAAGLRSELGGVEDTEEREATVRGHFLEVLRRLSGAPYFVPFRFERRESRQTSHFLVHCSKSKLAFKIMKHVMSDAGRETGARYGRLELPREGERGALGLFLPTVEVQKAKILERLGEGPCKVNKFTVGWHDRPVDLFSARDYKRMLMELEDAGTLTVWNKANSEPLPCEKRRGFPGRPTLGDDYWLRRNG